MVSLNEDLNESSSSRNTSMEYWEEVIPPRNDDGVRSEFPVKVTFLIGIHPHDHTTHDHSQMDTRDRLPVPKYDDKKEVYPDNWWT